MLDLSKIELFKNAEIIASYLNNILLKTEKNQN